MDSPIDIKKLRLDLMNFYGTALFAGFDAALEDLLQIDKESEEELIGRAIKEGVDLHKYTEWFSCTNRSTIKSSTPFFKRSWGFFDFGYLC